MALNAVRGPGVALDPPQYLYPVTINENPQVCGTNGITLPPGGSVYLPPGTFWVWPGKYSMVQAKDPVTQIWRPHGALGVNMPMMVSSDGNNFRISNNTGFPIGAQINNAGTGYTSAPTVSASVGGSTWQAIVGGAIGAITLGSGGAGANYGIQPIVNISAPPAPGVTATAVANISAGAVTSFTILNQGAGYLSAPTITIVPSPNDPNIGTITDAFATTVTSFVGQVTAILLTNKGGQPLTAAPSLSITGGGGSGATATPVMCWTVTGVTVTTPGSGYSAPVGIQSFGGTITSSAAATDNPFVSTDMLIPRQVNITATVGSGTGVSAGGTIIDGGLFAAPPTLYAIPGPAGAAASAVAVLTARVGGVNDTVFVQPV